MSDDGGSAYLQIVDIFKRIIGTFHQKHAVDRAVQRNGRFLFCTVVVLNRNGGLERRTYINRKYLKILQDLSVEQVFAGYGHRSDAGIDVVPIAQLVVIALGELVILIINIDSCLAFLAGEDHLFIADGYLTFKKVCRVVVNDIE